MHMALLCFPSARTSILACAALSGSIARASQVASPQHEDGSRLVPSDVATSTSVQARLRQWTSAPPQRIPSPGIRSRQARKAAASSPRPTSRRQWSTREIRSQLWLKPMPVKPTSQQSANLSWKCGACRISMRGCSAFCTFVSRSTNSKPRKLQNLLNARRIAATTAGSFRILMTRSGVSRRARTLKREGSSVGNSHWI